MGNGWHLGDDADARYAAGRACVVPSRAGSAQQFEGTSDLGIRIAGALAEVVGVVPMQQGAAAITAAAGGQALLLFSKAEGGARSETSVKQEASRSSYTKSG